mgnify:FL=1
MARIFGSFTPTPANEPPPGMYVPIEFPEMLLVGTRTHDGRLIDADSFSTLDLPRSIKLKVRDAPGHDNAEVSGRLDEVVVGDDGKVTGRGWLLNDDLGRRSAFLVKTQALRGNSVDLSVSQKDMKVRYVEEGAKFWMEMDFENARLKATTLLTEPAFDNASAVIPDGWDVEGYDEADTIVASILAAAPEDHEPAAETKAEHAFSFNVLAERPKIDHGLFLNPELREETPVYIDEHDHVYGHIAGWRTEHASLPGVYAPRSATDYAYFANKSVLTTEGRVATGNLVIGGDHAPEELGWREALNVYADSSTCWADVAIGEDDFGIWVSGIVRPGTSNEMVHAARASGQSGDWRRIGGNLELIISQCVNAEGFPKRRTRAFGHDSDYMLTLTGAGFITPKAPAAPSITVPPAMQYLANKFATDEAREVVASMAELDATFADS